MIVMSEKTKCPRCNEVMSFMQPCHLLCKNCGAHLDCSDKGNYWQSSSCPTDTTKPDRKEDARRVKNYFMFLRLGNFALSARANKQNHDDTLRSKIFLEKL